MQKAIPVFSEYLFGTQKMTQKFNHKLLDMWHALVYANKPNARIVAGYTDHGDVIARMSEEVLRNKDRVYNIGFSWGRVIDKVVLDPKGKVKSLQILVCPQAPSPAKVITYKGKDAAEYMKKRYGCSPWMHHTGLWNNLRINN